MGKEGICLVSLKSHYGVLQPNFKQCRLVQQKRFKSSKIYYVDCAEARCVVNSCLIQANVPKDDAEVTADVIVEADKRGHYPLGIHRFPKYLEEIKTNQIDVTARPNILKETAATAWIDGCNALGPVVGKYAMDVAIKKAQNCGASWVCAKSSNHFGIASYYALMATKCKFIGIAMSNGPPIMVAPNGKCRLLGANPIACAAAVSETNRFIVDMALTQSTRGKIKMFATQKSKIPKNWALNNKFEPTTDPKAALKADMLLPFGLYKGYGLASMVEVLAGVLSGANYSERFNSKLTKCDGINIGHAFAVVDPNRFSSDFRYFLCDFMDILRGLPIAKKCCSVLVPGDIEEENAECARKTGIPYTADEIKLFNDLAATYCIPSIKTKE